jgi:hypothetical protein
MPAAGEAAAIDESAVGSNYSGVGLVGTESTALIMIVK